MAAISNTFAGSGVRGWVAALTNTFSSLQRPSQRRGPSNISAFNVQDGSGVLAVGLHVLETERVRNHARSGLHRRPDRALEFLHGVGQQVAKDHVGRAV